MATGGEEFFLPDFERPEKDMENRANDLLRAPLEEGDLSLGVTDTAGAAWTGLDPNSSCSALWGVASDTAEEYSDMVR